LGSKIQGSRRVWGAVHPDHHHWCRFDHLKTHQLRAVTLQEKTAHFPPRDTRIQRLSARETELSPLLPESRAEPTSGGRCGRPSGAAPRPRLRRVRTGRLPIWEPFVAIAAGDVTNGVLTAGTPIEQNRENHVELPLRDILRVQGYLVLMGEQSKHVHLSMATLFCLVDLFRRPWRRSWHS